MEWLKVGLPYDEYWTRTPHEMAVILRGRNEAILAEFDRQRAVAYEQAQWFAIAVNDPRKLPAFETRSRPEPERDVIDQQVANAKLRGWFMARSRRVN